MPYDKAHCAKLCDWWIHKGPVMWKSFPCHDVHPCFLFSTGFRPLLTTAWATWHRFYRAWFHTLRPRQNGRHFADDTFKPIFLNENIRISIKISLKFVPKVPVNNMPALVQTMAWRRPGDKPLAEPMMVCLLMHICVTRPQWVKTLHYWPFVRESISNWWIHLTMGQ